MDEYITKPLEAAELARVIEQVAQDRGVPIEEKGKTSKEEPAYDRQAILKRFEGDEAFASEVIRLFLQDSPRMLEEIHQAVACGDGVRLKRAAHALKGSLGYLHAADALDAALQLELLGEEGDLADAIACLQTLETKLARLTQAISASLPELVQ
jgi:HPt (histidine-containing phosphotransfer) domain-containing protein